VGSGAGVEQEGVLDLLSGLADKSLVHADTTGAGAPRYGMLEPVRQYARERLEKSGEAEDIRRRHTAVLTALVEEAEPSLRGPESGIWLRRLDTRPPEDTLPQGICARAASRRASPMHPPPAGIRHVGGVYARRRSAPYRYVETTRLLGGPCSAVYDRIHVHGALRRSVGATPTPRRKLRRPGGTQTSEEDVVKRTSGCVPERSSRQKQGVTAAHPYTPMGGGGA
jgi:hypothetical protein